MKFKLIAAFFLLILSIGTQAEQAAPLLLSVNLERTQGYIFGHSYGTLSSKWLAKNLGNELAGSIHSASMTRAAGGAYGRYGNTATQIDMALLQAPVLNVHHGNDTCPSTPYAAVKQYSSNNLVTVRGGNSTGDRCGAKHFHSYEGREQAASEAIIAWIVNREVQQFAGDD